MKEDNKMKEEYTRFFDDGENQSFGCGFAIFLFLIPCLIIVAKNTPAAGALAVLVFLILFIVIFIFSLALQHASFEADDTQVTFSYFGKDTVISYDEIENLLIERRHNELRTKSGIQRCYVETLTITTAVRTYSFSAEMDIDYDKVAQDPASMTAQFENSAFSRLKCYIEDKQNANRKFSLFKNYIEYRQKGI